MTYLGTVTSQGQISIPAPLRHKYNIVKNKTIVFHDSNDGKILMEPVKDLLELGGSLKTNKKISSRKIKEAFGMGMATRHLQPGNFPFPHISPK